MPNNFAEVVSHQRLRRLESSTDEKPLIEIESIFGADSDPELTGFNWNLTTAGSKNLEFKLKYSYPLEIS